MAEDVVPIWSLPATEKEIDWETVYRNDFPRIYNYFRYRLGHDGAAEELAAETFVRAWRRREQYRADLAAFSTWMFTIARNLATDYLRRDRPEVELAQVENSGYEASGGPDVEKIVQIREDAARLETLLAQLPAREREIVSLKYGAELSNREIARVMDLSAVNVGVIVYRTVRKLRARWEEWE